MDADAENKIKIRIILKSNMDLITRRLNHYGISYSSENIGYGFKVQGFSQGDPARCVDWIKPALTNEEDDSIDYHLSRMIHINKDHQNLVPGREIFQYMTMIEDNAKKISRALAQYGLKYKVFAAMGQLTVNTSVEQIDVLMKRHAKTDSDRPNGSHDPSFLDIITHGIDFESEYPPPPYGGWKNIPEMKPPDQELVIKMNTKRALAALLGLGRGPVR